jgi:PAS domain S-box-containing protein
MAVRLEHGGKVYGLLSVSIPRDLVASEEEQALFEEAAADIAFALHSIELEEERKRAVEALRESEQFLQDTFEGIQDGISVLDGDLNIMRVNAWMKRTYASHAPLAGKKCYAVYQQRETPCPWCPSLPAMETGESHSEIVPYPSKENPTGWIDLSAYPLKDITGHVIGVIEHVKDITERKRAEEALRESEEKYRLLVENSRETIFVAQDGMLKFFNSQTMGITGYSREELASKPFVELIHPDDREMVVERHLKRLKGESLPHVYPFRIIERSGNIKWVEINAALITWEGKPATLNFLSDITERKRAEEALKEYSERLEEMVEERTKELRDAQEELVRKGKLAILGQLAGGVGHELRNPLGVISNAVYFLQMTLPDADETTATAKEYLEIISEEVRNSSKIISDLLDFSCTRMPEREEIAVSELVAEVLEKRPPPEGVEVTTRIAPDLPPVYVDPRQMGLVLVNLVVNAYQAMKEGGALTIKTSEVSEKLPKSKWIALSVSDTGCGISQEHMKKLFEPLFTTKARGIGLGLATSRILVEANGGSMEVESEEGKGSTFTVRLPTRGW